MSRDDLLGRLVGVLVDEWGLARVRQAVASLEDTAGLASAQRPGGARQSHDARTRRKPSPTDLARRVHGPTALKSAIEELARLFEAKLFLQSVGDVRHFLEMRGKELPASISRSESFPKILEELVDIPVDQLREIARKTELSGPSELAPLSNAIRTAGASLRPEVAHESGDNSATSEPPPKRS